MSRWPRKEERSDGDIRPPEGWKEETLMIQLRKRRTASRTRAVSTTIGFFAGIGGIELGLHRAGHRCILLCEIDPDAQAVLKKRFPGTPLRPDISKIKR